MYSMQYSTMQTMQTNKTA